MWPLYKPDRGKDSVFRDPIYLVDIKVSGLGSVFKVGWF